MVYSNDSMTTGTLYKWTGDVGMFMAEDPDSKLESSNNPQISLLGPYIQPGDVLLYIGSTKYNPDMRLFLHKETLAALHISMIDDLIHFKHLLPIAGHET
jgi:hypothetical protein